MAKYKTYSYLCTECGNEIPYPIDFTDEKKKFFVTDFFCPICAKCTEHLAVKDLDLLLSSINFMDEKTLTGNKKKVYSLVKKKRYRNDYR